MTENGEISLELLGCVNPVIAIERSWTGISDDWVFRPVKVIETVLSLSMLRPVLGEEEIDVPIIETENTPPSVN